SPRQSWPYNATRDAGLPQVGGGGGYPTCKQWWADSGIGLRDRIKGQVDPDLMTSFLKWAKWLDQDEVTEAVIRQVISPSSQVKGNVYTDYGGQVGGTVWNGIA
ncbi:conjugal transfer protein TraG N-terminal domain-containing protein, partial [Pseudomonas aeruginosa]